MKHALLGLLCLGGLLAGALAQGQPKEEPSGLELFKFGNTWAELRQQAIREYGLEKAKGGFDSWRQPKEKGKLYFSFRNVTMDGEPGEKDLVIDHWPVAGKEYEVQFQFDAKERFYAYRIIEIPSVDLKDYDTVVGERLRRWKAIFTEKYGPATADGKLPDPQSLKGVHTAVTTWKFKNHTASIVVFHRGRSYNVHAVVQDDRLAP